MPHGFYAWPATPHYESMQIGQSNGELITKK